MEYQCKTMSIAKLPVSSDGVEDSLCDSCDCFDCSNPIMSYEVSVFGINETHRVYWKRSGPAWVISCQGYIEKKE